MPLGINGDHQQSYLSLNGEFLYNSLSVPICLFTFSYCCNFFKPPTTYVIYLYEADNEVYFVAQKSYLSFYETMHIFIYGK